MALIELEQPGSGPLVLFNEHTLGRSSRCDTNLDHPDTSSRHALIFYSDDAWWIRDLGSTNGTLLNTKAIEPGVRARLTKGDRITLGKESVRVIDTSAPVPGVFNLTTREMVTGGASLLVLTRDNANCSLTLEQGQHWWLEVAGHSQELKDGEIFHFAGQSYQFSAGSTRNRTARSDSLPLRLADMTLSFSVSLDEEHVALTGRLGDQDFDFKSRAHHYTLLTLARQRLADQNTTPALPASSHGWVSSAQLITQLGSNETKLSVEICRIRQQFSKAGVTDAADIIERRRGTGQLRIGTGALFVARV